MITYKQADIIKEFKECPDYPILAHQANCFKMGSGVAAAILKEWPDSQLEESNWPIKRFGDNKLYYPKIKGVSQKGLIVNMCSQFYPGPCAPSDNIDNFEMRKKALGNCLYYLKHTVEEHNYMANSMTQFCSFPFPAKILMPLVASGLAADKAMKKNMTDLEYFKLYIAPVVEEILKDIDVTVCYL